MASPARDFMALTPIKLTPSPRKRKVTPSPELSSSKKRMIVLQSGTLPPSQLIEPANHSLLSPSRHLLPKKVEVAKIEAPSLADSRHIILDFDLSKDPEIFFDSKGTTALSHLFPESKEIAFDRMFLSIRFDELPAKPWPFTIAGVPCYFTTERGDYGPLMKMLSSRPHTNVRILDHIDARVRTIGINTTLFDDHVGEVFEYFRKTNLQVTQLQNWNYFVVLVLQDKDQVNQYLPKTIMRIGCLIMFKDDIKANRQPALRMKEPKMTDPPEYDDEKYEVLRPGVMLTSESLGSEGSLTTTSGVLVQKGSGPKALTVAAHGFPNMGPVHHPRSTGRIIGSIIEDFSPQFDISLVRLENHEKFINETFDSAEDNDSCRLIRLAPLRGLLFGDIVSMNNPFVGRCDAWLGPITYDPYVVRQGDEKSFWLAIGEWFWMGQGSSSMLPDGICGTPIINDRDEVLGFFRFVGDGLMKDFSFATAAENLIREGYQICKE